MTTTASWYHCSVKPVKRSSGRSVVAAAAYRLGEKLHDEKTDLTHDYSKRKGIENTFTLAPDSAPDWVQNPEKLWNAAEDSEKRINSQLAREIELALPASVSSEQREAIAQAFASHLVERYGVAVSVALHEPSGHGDDRNHHAHILMTTRRVNAEGFGAKTRELDDRKTGSAEVQHIREMAAHFINAALADSGSDERVDHRSFKERGIDQLPTEHLGVEAANMERRGEISDRGDRNREIERVNQNTKTLFEERDALDAAIAEAQKAIREAAIAELDSAIAEIKQQIAERDAPKPREEGGLTEAERAMWQEALAALPETAEINVKKQELPSKWQDRIKAERQGSEGGAPPPAPLPKESEGFSIFDQPSVTEWEAQLQKQGTVEQGGLIGKWWDQAAEWVQQAKHGLYDTWQRWLGRDDPDNSPWKDR